MLPLAWAGAGGFNGAPLGFDQRLDDGKAQAAATRFAAA